MVNSIFVTGITGFIGSNLLQLLLSNYEYVVNFSKNDVIQEYSKDKLKKINFDEFDETKYSVKVLINLATNYNPNPKNNDELEKIISSNTFFPLGLVTKVKCIDNLKLINTSSYLQLLEPSLQNEYSLSKQIFLKYASRIFPEIVNIHLFDTFGIKDKRNKVVDVFIKKIIKNECITIPKNEIHINLSNIEDVAYSIFSTIDKQYFENLMIKSENNFTLSCLIEKLFDLMGKHVEVLRKNEASNYLNYFKSDVKNIYTKKSAMSFDEQLEIQIQSHLGR